MRYEYLNKKIGFPKISLILLDWSCRESFHVLQYLNKQNISRDNYEIIWIEYYDRVPDNLKKILNKSINNGSYPLLDQWIIIEMPKNIYYHKHLMYNIGIALSHGDIILIGDSDAIVTSTLIESVINAFDKNENIVLHMDQFRNVRHDFYPFNFPPIKEILGEGCVNIKDGKTTGVLDFHDPLHTRNYGACMCARKKDIIAIGGADEYIDYLGHVCGPYELTFRLRNNGKKEIWHLDEFLYHVWHPGQAGEANYLGPHDGRHMSTTALKTLKTGRKMPLVENPVIRSIRKCGSISLDQIFTSIISPEYLRDWHIQQLNNKMELQKEIIHPVSDNFRGFKIFSVKGYYYAVKREEEFFLEKIGLYLSAKDLDVIKKSILIRVINHHKNGKVCLFNKFRYYATKLKYSIKRLIKLRLRHFRKI